MKDSIYKRLQALEEKASPEPIIIEAYDYRTGEPYNRETVQVTFEEFRENTDHLGFKRIAKAPAPNKRTLAAVDFILDSIERDAYLSAAWSGKQKTDSEQAARYCRAVYEAGFSPICPILYLPLFLNDAVPEEHKSGIDIGRDLLRRAHVLVVCGNTIDENVKNDIAIAGRLHITATTLEGIMAVKGQGVKRQDSR